MPRFSQRSIAAAVLLSLGIGAFWMHLTAFPEPQNEPFSFKSAEALALLHSVRSYPHASIPSEGFAQAFNQLVPSEAAKNEHTHAWHAIGPNNMGGRTLALAFNPQNTNTIYAGSASGGLWRSYSAGVGDQAWHYVVTGFPVLGVAAIAIAPNDSNIIYIGTGEVYGIAGATPGIIQRTTRGIYGIGLLKSTDGGQTWTQSIDWSAHQRRGIQKIRLNPKRPESVWAATTEGIYRSYNAGESWTLVYPVAMATDLAINPIDTSIVFSAQGGQGSPGGGIVRTLDGGTTWEHAALGTNGPLAFGGKVMLAMAPSAPNVLYASIGKADGTRFGPSFLGTWLYQTVDGGDTWQVVSTVDYSSYQGWYAHDVAVHPSFPEVVWTAGVSSVPYLSTEGGRNLRPVSDIGLFSPSSSERGYPTQLSHPDFHEILFHPTNPFVIYFANDGGVFRTTDGGVTFENCNGGYQTTQFYAGFANATHDSSYALGGLQDNSSILYTGSSRWTSVGTGDGGHAGIIGDTLFFSRQGLRLFYAIDRGAGPSVEISPPVSGPLFIAPFLISPANPNRFYAGAQNFLRSDDRGVTWRSSPAFNQIARSAIGAIASSRQDANTVYVATVPSLRRPEVYHSPDGGTSWNVITGELPDRFPTDLAVDPTDDTRLYITFGGFGTSHVFRSMNAGLEWKDVGQGLPDLPAWSVTIDPLFPEHIYVGNDVGVFASFDDGSTWQYLNKGLPDAIIAMDLVISPANRKLRVATHGNGVFEYPLERPMTPTTHEVFSSISVTLLEPPYPNPFTEFISIPYQIKQSQLVRLDVFDALGRKQKTLVNAMQSAGRHVVQWSPSNLSPGNYFIRLTTTSASHTQAVIYMR